jgi:hypothetical protein
LWVDGTNSYLSSGNTGADPLVLNLGGGNVGIGCVPQGNLDIDVAVDTSLGLRSQTGVIVSQYTGAPAVGNRAQIGLGYGNTYTNVSIGAVRTSATAYGTDDFIIATKSGTADTAPTERLRVDASGNLLVGTSSSSGDTANSKPVVAGNFTTKYGVSSIPSVNTWTTVHTFGSNQGNFMVSMRASGTGNIADNSVSIVAINGSATTHTSLLSGANVLIRIVGLTLQVYQNVFAGANISWSIMSIGN